MNQRSVVSDHQQTQSDRSSQLIWIQDSKFIKCFKETVWEWVWLFTDQRFGKQQTHFCKMPRSDTWLGGVELDKMREMDSAGSCDSVVSINSGFSDDSLEYLSAEEKACLMFLEETLEALEMEEDSGLSNDEPEPGNLVTRMADLTACMSQSNITDVSLCRKEEPVNKIGKDHNQILNYLVPTPLVMANGSTDVLQKSRKGFATKGGSFIKPATLAMISKAPQTHPTVPSEGNVVVIPPAVESISPVRTIDHPAPLEQRSAEVVSPRAPLSYEGLVQLRKAASMKRTQEGSHYAENQDKQPSKPMKHILLDDRGPHAPADQHGFRKPSPPAVAPKPKKIASTPTSTTCPQTEKTVMNPQKVRMEALYKLGLLKDQESPTTPNPSQPHQSKWVHPPSCLPPPPQHSDPSSLPDPPYCKPPPVPTAAEPKMRQTHWTSGVVHHSSLGDLTSGIQQLTVKPMTGKSATLERSGQGLSSSLSSHTISDSDRNARNTNNNSRNSILHRTKPHSSSLDMKIDCNDSGQRKRGDSLQRKSPETGIHGQTLSQPVGHSVLVVPRMGEDRREALKKLGLLKD